MCYESFLHFSSPVDNLKLKFHDEILVSLSYSDVSSENENTLANEKCHSAHKKCSFLLNQYFKSAIAFTEIPLKTHGTGFQRAVWAEISKIPLGETRTYGEIATKINSSPRAVGNACRNNPIPIIIPCHRVVSANSIGGYEGETQGGKINVKRWLLNHEGVEL